MRSRGNLLGLHLAGGLSLAGWAGLAIASHSIRWPLWIYLSVAMGQWLIFVVAWRLASKCDAARAALPIQLWAALFFICGMFAVPVMEDDPFRFLWDGRQFALTGNPYGTPPSAAFGDASVPEQFQQILDHINYPHVPTIYGPICEVGFLVSYWMAPGQLWPWKLMLGMAAMLLMRLTLSLARDLHAKGSSRVPTASAPAAALLVGWCPLLVFETVFNAHPDLLGIVLLTAAMLFYRREQPGRCGLFCGLAAASKVFALPLVPFLLRRSRHGWMAFAASFLVAYVPFWLQGTAADFAGLAEFAKDWEFNSSIYALARLASGTQAAKVICALIFFAAWVLLWWRWNKSFMSPAASNRMPPGALIYGALFLTSTTVNPWYLQWLIPFVAVEPGLIGFTAMALVSLSYVTGLNAGISALGNFEHPIWVRIVEYGGITLTAMIQGWRWNEERSTKCAAREPQ